MKFVIAAILCGLFASSIIDLELQLDWMRSRVPGFVKEQTKIIARLQSAI